MARMLNTRTCSNIKKYTYRKKTGNLAVSRGRENIFEEAHKNGYIHDNTRSKVFLGTNVRFHHIVSLALKKQNKKAFEDHSFRMVAELPKV